MPWSDASVEAFLDAYMGDDGYEWREQTGVERLRKSVLDGLKAAERAAWSSDMEAAPRTEDVLVLGMHPPGSMNHGPTEFWAVASVTGDAAYPFEDLEGPRPAGFYTAWRHLPTPPQEPDG